MACQIIPIVRVGDFRFLGTIINELPARDTQGRATASGGTAPVSAPHSRPEGRAGSAVEVETSPRLGGAFTPVSPFHASGDSHVAQ